MRQQTISEWETGVYQPRGASTRLLIDHRRPRRVHLRRRRAVTALLIADERATYDAGSITLPDDPPAPTTERPTSNVEHPATDPASRIPPHASTCCSRLQPPHLTEAQLTALWRGRRFPDGALVTRAGVPVRVIFQGRAGPRAGAGLSRRRRSPGRPACRCAATSNCTCASSDVPRARTSRRPRVRQRRAARRLRG